MKIEHLPCAPSASRSALSKSASTFPKFEKKAVRFSSLLRFSSLGVQSLESTGVILLSLSACRAALLVLAVHTQLVVVFNIFKVVLGCPNLPIERV